MVLVGDASTNRKMLAQASERGIPVASAEWVIQCLITGKILGVSEHPKFRLALDTGNRTNIDCELILHCSGNLMRIELHTNHALHTEWIQFLLQFLKKTALP